MFLFLTALIGLPSSLAHAIPRPRFSPPDCIQALARVTQKEDLVHPSLRASLFSGRPPQQQLLDLFLFLQTRPKLTDRDFYYVLQRLPRGVEMQKKAGQRELREQILKLGLASGARYPKPYDEFINADAQIDANLIFMAASLVWEVSRPDLWQGSYSAVLDFLRSSQAWAVQGQFTPFRAQVMGVFFDLFDRTPGAWRSGD